MNDAVTPFLSDKEVYVQVWLSLFYNSIWNESSALELKELLCFY
jgi:hypothetical protein